MAAKIKKGDRVVVQTGRFKGKQGLIDAVVRGGTYVHVQGCTRIKHVRANPERQVEGGRVHVAMPIHVSNVSHIDPEGRAFRVGFADHEGNKVRINRRTQEQIDN